MISPGLLLFIFTTLQICKIRKILKKFSKNCSTYSHLNLLLLTILVMEHPEYPGYMSTKRYPHLFVNAKGRVVNDPSVNSSVVISPELAAQFDRLQNSLKTHEEARSTTTGSRYRVAGSLAGLFLDIFRDVSIPIWVWVGYIYSGYYRGVCDFLIS